MGAAGQGTAPTVTITSPSAGERFAAPATLTVSATAIGHGATVTNVEFLANTNVLGSSHAAPFSATASNLTTGVYTLSAIATDSNGLQATNSVSINAVTAGLPGVTLSVLLYFNGTNGRSPVAALTQGADGSFYGTTSAGGTNGADEGTVFKITTNGAFTSLYSFTGGNNGANLEAGLVQDNSGNLFGTTAYYGAGASGTIFKITSNGALTPLYPFTGGSDGANPYSTMVGGPGGYLYGTTVSGGLYSKGTIFKITTNGSLTTLYPFAGTNDGYYPNGLVQGADGNVYGTTAYGGTNSHGGVFKITPGGAFANLYSFSGGAFGATPVATLVQGADGYLYGSTVSGGLHGQGTIFKITTNGSLTTLYSFTGTNDGNYPTGLVQAGDGNFYGTTEYGGAYANGTVFKMTTNGAFLSLYSFAGGNDGANPGAGLIQGRDGNFYGTASQGGQRNGGLYGGTVFRLSIPPPPSIVSQPTNLNVWSGTTNSFTILAASSAPLSYQWQRDGTNLVDGGNIVGSKTATLTLNSVSMNDVQPYYDVVVSNPYGSVISDQVDVNAVASIEWPSPQYITYGSALSSQLDALAYYYAADFSPFDPPQQIAVLPTYSFPSGKLYVGTYILSANFIVNPMYNNGLTLPAFTTNVTLTVDAKDLYVTLPDATRPYGQPNPSANVSLSGLVNNDAIQFAVEDNVAASAPPGVYYLQVTNQDPANLLANYNVTYSGYATLTVTAPDESGNTTPPGNDNFANRINLAGSNPVDTGNNLGATMEPDEPYPGGPIPSVTHSVWWSWVAPTNGWIKLDATGSSFETFLNVYTGNALSNLVCVASNLDAIVGESGISNQVSFAATAGTVYQICVSGFAEGTIEFAIQPVTFQIVDLQTNVNMTNSTTEFHATVQIDNAGSAAVGQLRIELVAVAGYSWQAEFTGPPTASDLPAQVELGIFDLTNAASLAPGQTTDISISGICPGPTNVNNVGYGWAVFGILEEEVGTNWLAIETDLVFYGVWPTIGGFNGPGGGVIRVDPSASAGGPFQITSATINGPSSVSANSTNSFYGTVDLSNGSTGTSNNFTNTFWTVNPTSSFSINSNGVFSAGTVTSNTPVTITAYFFFSGTEYPISKTVTVIDPPTLGDVEVLTGKRLRFVVSGQPGSRYVIKTATNLSLATVWSAVATNTTGASGQWTFTNTIATNVPARFYRAVQSP